MSEEQTEQAQPKGLYQKIAAVMKQVDYLQKDGKVDFNKTKYNVITEEKVTSAVRKAMVDVGLVILPIDQEHIREGTLTTVNTKYKIVDIETGQHEIIVSSGTGVDTQDKGVGKAMTYSYKYMLLRTFAIPTGEDPDKTSSAELDEKQGAPQQEDNNNSQGQQLASEKQMNFITKLIGDIAKSKNISDEEAYKTLKVRMKKDLEWYTPKDASQAIKLLQDVLKKGA